MNEKHMTCDDCEAQLFEFHEGALEPAQASEIDAHLKNCDECTQRLNDIWQMNLVASRWQNKTAPTVDHRGDLPFDRQSWQFPQIFATAASLLALIVVLTDANFTRTDNGFALNFGDAGYISQADLVKAQQSQREEFSSRLDALTAQQVASDQLVLRSVLQASREERRQEIGSLVSYVNATQTKQYRETEENLRYLLASQAEDERDIKQLNNAFQQIGLNRTNNM